MKHEPIILSTKVLRPDVQLAASQNEVELLMADFIMIDFIDPGESAKEILSSHHPLILTSQQGVRALEKISYDGKTGFKNRDVYCIAGETRKATELIPSLYIIGTAVNAVSLAELIIDQNRSQTYHYICGTSRRDALPELLKAAGKAVKEYPLYRTVLTGSKITTFFDAVLFFSPSGADSFFQSNLLSNDVPCFCIGETTAAAVEGHGGRVAGIAAEPDQRKVLETAISYFKKSRKKQRL
ncbi:uroporphyrinogen-III synthase [Pollutibacter soli]|uniref:uroporphyrinogen-III synthase n=1 Tax=Pollutibacter soli TaxID=3034157 RepID=UPI0030140D1B